MTDTHEKENVALRVTLSKANALILQQQARIAELEGGVHLNNPGDLPPVNCPLLIEIAPGRLVRAERPSMVERRGNDLTYRLSDGNEIHGQLRWTYP